jgi:DNA polymerase-3 subunit epsilon
MRQVVLDTETTGLEVDQGHRIIEIGCVELKHRRPTGQNFQRYLNPDRPSDPGAVAIHGLTDAFLADKPRFADIARELLDYLKGAELLIHNASFDVGFVNKELARCGIDTPLESLCTVTDTVSMARKLHPGQRASLDALCQRYGVNNSNRKFHGALLDAELLAEVYLAMTGGQSRLLLEGSGSAGAPRRSRVLEQLQSSSAGKPAIVIAASEAEWAAHRQRLQGLVKKSGATAWPQDLEATPP